MRKILVLLLVLCAVPAAAQVTIDAVTANGEVSSTTCNFSHTIAGAERELLVTVHHTSNSENVSSGTWNTSENLALVEKDRDADSDNTAIEIWGLKAPSTGTHTVAITMSGSVNMVCVASSFNAVNQTTPLGTAVKDHYTGSGTSHSHNTTSQTNGLVWDAFMLQEGGGTITVNGGQTTRAGSTTINTTSKMIDTTKAGATTTSTGYSWPNDFFRWTHITVPLNPSSGGGSTTKNSMMRGMIGR